MVYKPGEDNVVTDCLSRAYEDDTVASSVAVPSESPSLDEDEEDDAIIQTLFGTFSTSVISIEEIAAATDVDATLSTVR